MATIKAALIPGDGIGPEVTSLTLKVLEAAEVPLEFEVFELGEPAIKKYNEPAPEELLNELKKYNVMLKGPLTTPIGTGYRSVNVVLRKVFDTYAVVRPARSLPVSWLYHDVPRYSNIDLVLVREATEEFYAGIEHDIVAEGERIAAESIGVVTRKNSERIIRFAFEYAKKNKRKKVTVVTKANVLKLTGGLFLEVYRDVAKDYPEIEKEEMLVDNMAMQLVLRPKDYDVIVTTNLMGDILSDLISGLIGGLGVAPSSNIGDKYAIFEPVHGSAPKYTNQWKVNPTAQILTATSMLRFLGLNEKAELIEKAVFKTLNEKKALTYDMVRILKNAGFSDIKESSNREFTEEVIKNIKQII
jgi:Isocitrate/isopropylmalate dehydrogenase